MPPAAHAGVEGARSPDPRPVGREGAKPEGAEGRQQRPRPPWERGFVMALPGAAPRSAHTAERVAATAPAGPRTPALLLVCRKCGNVHRSQRRMISEVPQETGLTKRYLKIIKWRGAPSSDHAPLGSRQRGASACHPAHGPSRAEGLVTATWWLPGLPV